MVGAECMRTALLLVLLTLAAGCTTKDVPDTTASDDSNTEIPPEVPPVAVAVAVALHNDPGVGVPPTTMGIDPPTLAFSLGVPVNLTITNRGSGIHNLVIDGLDVASDNIDAGASVSILFTPTEEGTFDMYCSIGGNGPAGHRAQGMAGSVTVS